MKHLFIINPAAGKRDKTELLTQEIHNLCRPQGLNYEIYVSQAPGDCTRKTRQAAVCENELRIYACGGDGTLNEVVAGAACCANVSVSHFACGSGNDFVKLFSEPEAFHALPRLLDCEETEFDLISCNGDYAANICSVGLDARIGTEVAAYKRLPWISGGGAYLLSSLVNVLRGVTEHYIVEIDGERIDGRLTMICVANGRFYGGGFNPVPDAQPDDGLLDVLLVQPVSRLQIAAIIGKYKNGLYAQYPHLIRHLRTKSLKIICDQETAINLDGELRKAQTVEFKVAAEKLRFFYPKGLSWRSRESNPEKTAVIGR